MDIELLDVILVGREDTMSLSREGIYDKKKYGHNLSVLADNYMREEIDIPDHGEDLPELDHGL